MSICTSLIFIKPNYFTIIFISICTSVLFSCSEPLEVKGFDVMSWKSDKMACNNTRADYEKTLMDAREQLIGATQEEIIQFLGRPERQELYNRGQKFYIYFLSPSPECYENVAPPAPSRLLYVRFSAVNKVNEIFVQQL